MFNLSTIVPFTVDWPLTTNLGVKQFSGEIEEGEKVVLVLASANILV